MCLFLWYFQLISSVLNNYRIIYFSSLVVSSNKQLFPVIMYILTARNWHVLSSLYLYFISLLKRETRISSLLCFCPLKSTGSGLSLTVRSSDTKASLYKLHCCEPWNWLTKVLTIKAAGMSFSVSFFSSILPSFLPCYLSRLLPTLLSFPLSFLSFFLSPFLPLFLSFFLPFLLPSFLPFFLASSLPLFLPYFLFCFFSLHYCGPLLILNLKISF